MNLEYIAQQIVNGLILGSMYAMVAIGFSMIYGIIRLINFAHGEVYMIGAFTALIVASILSILGWNEIAILFIASVVAVVARSPPRPRGQTVESAAKRG